MDEFIEPKAKIETEFFLATVAEVDDEDGISIIPEGQASATGKKYKMLINGGFTPEAGDRVVVLKQSGTFVILGKIGYPEDNTGGGEITYPIAVDKGGTGATTAAAARTNLGAAAATDLAGKVAKAGDTMSGNLVVSRSNPMFGAQNKSKDVTSESYSETYSSSGLLFTDENGYYVAQFTDRYETGGETGVLIGANKRISGSNNWNYLRLLVKPDGSKRVLVTDPAAWRSGLGAVNKAGDTMTGSLTISNTNPGSLLKNTARTDEETVSASTNSVGFRLVDKNGKVYALFTDRWLSDGRQGVWITAIRGSVYHGIRYLINSSGTPSVVIDYPAAFRAGLGLGTNGALPITIAQGGSGQTAVTTTTTASQIVTAAANWSITSANYSQWGKLAMVYIRAKTTAQVTTTTTTTIMTIASGKRPVQAAPLRVWLSNSYQAVINTDGTVYMSGATISANSEFTFIGTYLLP